jgi:hypothetical protein
VAKKIVRWLAALLVRDGITVQTAVGLGAAKFVKQHTCQRNGTVANATG